MLQTAKSQPNEVKTILLGNAGSGKTSLLELILGGGVNKDNVSVTHGLTINDWEFETAKDNICVHLWDFNMQHITSSTHQFFLSKNCLYIIVLDGRKDDDPEHWLKIIKNFGGDSPVLIVINKLDLNPDCDLNRKNLKDKYKTIKGFYQLSCTTKKSFDQFLTDLKLHISEVSFLETQWPISWLNVKGKLKDIKKDYISYDEYVNICSVEQINLVEKQSTLIKLLGDLGIILHFNDSLLQETIVINPEWIIGAVHTILFSKTLANNKGILKKTLLKTVLNIEKYAIRKHNYILELMKKFKIGYELDTETFLIPNLLDLNQPDLEFVTKETLKFVFEYNILPKSVIIEFIIRKYKDVDNNMIWRTGIVVNDETFNTKTLVRAEENGNKIFIYINGLQKRDCLAVIRKIFSDINKQYRDVCVTESVPLPDNDISIEYADLIGHEEMGLEEIVVTKIGKKYNVNQLLNGIDTKTAEPTSHTKKSILPKDDNSVPLFFNTAGPVDKTKHYCLDPLKRFNLRVIKNLIDQEKYFVLHAPRQTGKTTCLLALMHYLNTSGYCCVYLNVEPAQVARENVADGIQAILSTLALNAKIYIDDNFVEKIWPNIFKESGAYSALSNTLSKWSKHNQKPLVLFIDEIDALVGDTLISVLRQLRSGFNLRPSNFPQSIILCGVRDVRDYRIHSTSTRDIITGGSAFNIKSESLRLDYFSKEETKQLLLQHTTLTGQQFTDEAIDHVWEITGGQPWLINALANEACFKNNNNGESQDVITKDLIDSAKEKLILRRDTHLDQLTDKLKEVRVKKVIEPLISGNDNITDILDDDIDYVYDLGLITKQPQVRIANRIYMEIIPRVLTYGTERFIAHEQSWYLNVDGAIDMQKLMLAFQQFFREHFEHWLEGYQYKEAGAQLLLQAFLQRIVNGGGRIEREYGLGRLRTDLLIIYPYSYGTQKIVIELKLVHNKTLSTVKEKGLEQTFDYMDICNTEEGHLVIFDRSKTKTWDEKIFSESINYKNKIINVWGM